MKRQRIRDLGYKPGGFETGRYNAITDVEGVGVGHVTIIEDDDIRTGVTAITPHSGNLFEEKVPAAVDILNGYGKTVGLSQVLFEGRIETPIMLTETLNTYRVADSVIDYYADIMDYRPRSLNALVGETNGGYLTDNFVRAVTKEHVYETIELARKGCGTPDEGAVGAGTPMTGYGFKGGIGTSSRKVGAATVGVLVQFNCGRKEDLTILGAPVGKKVELPSEPEKSLDNSIMMIVATDVDIETRQLWKLAKRTTLGLARTGTYSSNGSGDFSISFTTRGVSQEDYLESIELGTPRDDGFLSPLYKGVVESTEEAIINALFMAETMTGYKGNTRHALPLDQTLSVLDWYHGEK
jgi:D-aminopeptidase